MGTKINFWYRYKSPRQDRRVVEDGVFVENGKLQHPQPPVEEQPQAVPNPVPEASAELKEMEAIVQETTARMEEADGQETTAAGDGPVAGTGTGAADGAGETDGTVPGNRPSEEEPLPPGIYTATIESVQETGERIAVTAVVETTGEIAKEKVLTPEESEALAEAIILGNQYTGTDEEDGDFDPAPGREVGGGYTLRETTRE